MEIPDDDTTQEAYDPHYDDESTHTGEDDLSYDTSIDRGDGDDDDGGNDDDDDGDDDNDDDDDGDDDNDDGHPVHVPLPNGHGGLNAVAPDPPILDNDPVIFAPDNTNEDDHSFTDGSQEPMDGPEDLLSTGVGDEVSDLVDIVHIDDTEEAAGVENPNYTGVGENATPMMESTVDDESSDDEDTHPTTESHKFEQAVADRKSRAIGGNDQ